MISNKNAYHRDKKNIARGEALEKKNITTVSPVG
jgi:hypothetical protein